MACVFAYLYARIAGDFRDEAVTYRQVVGGDGATRHPHIVRQHHFRQFLDRGFDTG